MRGRQADSNAYRAQLQGAHVLLLFDGWCGICTRTADWVGAHDPGGRVRSLPSQTPGILDGTGLTRAQTDAAAWALTADGHRYAGAAAINRTLLELQPAWCHALARFYAIPVVRWCEDRFYAWFARNRGRFARWGHTPACDRGLPCEPEGR